MTTTLTVEIRETDQQKLAEFLAQLGGKIVTDSKRKIAAKAAKKQQILDDLEGSIEFIKLHEAGKVEARSIQELLSEL